MKQYIIGSAPATTKGQSPIVVSDPHVSRTHCRVFFDNGQVYIEDLGSRNGTYVDGVRIQSPTCIYENSSVMLAGKYPFNFFNYVSSERPMPSQGVSEYAPFSTRFIAYFVDGIIIGIPFILFSILLEIIFWRIPSLVLLGQLGAFILIVQFYFALPISQKGTTFGRKMFGVEYLSLSTMDYPGVGIVWLRVLGYILSSAFFGIGFLLPLFNEKKQALHDLLANTIVVKK